MSLMCVVCCIENVIYRKEWCPNCVNWLNGKIKQNVLWNGCLACCDVCVGKVESR